jgi:hypothetical protein
VDAKCDTCQPCFEGVSVLLKDDESGSRGGGEW